MEPITFLDCSKTSGTETLFGTIQNDEQGAYIEELERGICFSLPSTVHLPTNTPVTFVIPNPTPGVFQEDYHDQVMAVKVMLVN